MKTSVEHIINNSIQLHVSGSATAHASNEKGEPLNEKGEPQMITEPSIWS